MALQALRNRRLHSGGDSKEGDFRSPSQKDRDRILYTSAFRRLAEVTQVVAANNAHVFHNRLTHSLQVAQVGRRITENLARAPASLLDEVGGLDPDVVEAGCLAHDLGHPPFGHAAEEELNDSLGKECGGFEGNAQSFRIVSKLAFKSVDHRGLDLTCATLSAILKYPWFLGENPQYPSKWGAYKSEEKDFRFARDLMPGEELQRTAEADIMDWADDVTYAVHDIEDFYRAGRVPLHLLANRHDDKERKEFFEDVFDRRKGAGGIWTSPRSDLEEAFTDLIVLNFRIDQPFYGTQDQRSRLRKFTAFLIGRFINAIELRRPTPENRSRTQSNPELVKEVAMLKELTWTYVIKAPSLAAHQHGQRRVIHELFQILCEAALNRRTRKILPIFYQQQMEDCLDSEVKRLVVDLIAGMTERQAVAMHQRLKGLAPGSGLEEILA